jgi:hypothetical protein
VIQKCPKSPFAKTSKIKNMRRSFVLLRGKAAYSRREYLTPPVTISTELPSKSSSHVKTYNDLVHQLQGVKGDMNAKKVIRTIELMASLGHPSSHTKRILVNLGLIKRVSTFFVIVKNVMDLCIITIK